MSGDFARIAFPNESQEYRTARNALLDAEIELRRQTEAVAALRRALPPGGEVPEDFVFERIGASFRPEKVKLSELFGDFPTVLVYSYMFGPERDTPCPGCTHLLDCIDDAARHVTIRHFWGSELVFAPEDPGQHHRGLDFADPVWGLLDTTPDGRGESFFPKVEYQDTDPQARHLRGRRRHRGEER